MEQCRFNWLSNCSANKGLNLVKFAVNISRDSVTVDAGTVDDNPSNTPKIGTTATDKADGDKVVGIDENITVVDTVHYMNLEPGKEYTMTGVLHLVNEDGTDAGIIESSKTSVTFTPENLEGDVKVELPVNTKDLKGQKLVVFEDCAENELTVATHADITDEGQTVTVEKDSNDMPNTGDKNLVPVVAIILIIATTIGGIAFYRRKLH